MEPKAQATTCSLGSFVEDSLLGSPTTAITICVSEGEKSEEAESYSEGVVKVARRHARQDTHWLDGLKIPKIFDRSTAFSAPLALLC